MAILIKWHSALYNKGAIDDGHSDEIPKAIYTAKKWQKRQKTAFKSFPLEDYWVCSDLGVESEMNL